MENTSQNLDKSNDKPVETDYAKHQDNPAPAPTVNEPDNAGAGQAMKWVIPIVLIVLLIVWFFFFKSETPSS